MLFTPTEFDHHGHRIVFGHDVVDRVGELAREYSAGRVLLVTDNHLVEAGHGPRAQAALEQAGMEVVCFDQVHENPTTRDVDACLRAVDHVPIDLIVGLGGGSSMDTAKGCNFLLTNGGRMQDYWGVGKATKPMLPMIAVPTTAGTGSECQSFALIADEKTHQKMACGDVKAAPCIALLDPKLTLTQPRLVTVCTGIDALTHAVETAVTKPANALSKMYSREAFRLISGNLLRVTEDGSDLDARGAMLLGAALAGLAIENSMLGAAHSAANPLTARFEIVHGQAVGMMLPHVMRFNVEEPGVANGYAALSREAGLAGGDDREAAMGLIQFVQQVLGETELPATLNDCGIEESAIGELAREAAGQWTAKFNPRPICEADFAVLYEEAYSQP